MNGFFKDIPPVFKGIIALAAAAAIGWGGWKIYKKVQENKEQKGANAEVNSAEKELNNKIQNGMSPTLSSSQLSAMADRIFTALNGYGTDEVAVARVFDQLGNDVDFLGLIKAYGIREISSGKWSPEPNLKGSLTQALVDELGTPEISIINKGLKMKGITYKF